jgi:hypothetical protein
VFTDEVRRDAQRAADTPVYDIELKRSTALGSMHARDRDGHGHGR